MRDKLENEQVRDWLFGHDIVVISETKTTAPPSVPGFIAINNSKSRRGGVAVLVKRKVYQFVTAIDIQDEDMIWYELTVIPGVKFGAIYNEPTDSTFFRPQTLASISAHVDSDKLCVICGDFNARLGNAVRRLGGGDALEYGIVDNGNNPNGKSLLDICLGSNLAVVNNVTTSHGSFPGALTYRQRRRWVSELDLCVVSRELINCVAGLTVNQDLRFPSDHAPVSVTFDFSQSRLGYLGLPQLVERSALLGSYPEPSTMSQRKAIRYRHFDHHQFSRQANTRVPPAMTSSDALLELQVVTDLMYECSESSLTKPAEPQYSRPDRPQSRWKRMLAENDSKTLWQGIDWNGEYKETDSTECPPEAAFQEHMERILNPDGVEPLQVDLTGQPYLPQLDDPFTFTEFEHVVRDQIKPDKGCGPDGISPGAIRLLPISWMMFLLTVCNVLFSTGTYPASWAASKLIMLFKKGSRMVCGNYRGISVIDALAKLYDYLLNNRLCAWIQPKREQAGAQPGRGCIEHIVTLRLLFDYSKRKRKPLFVAFIDFSKAYDRVPRKYLLELLKRLGCGVVMLAALISLYSLTQFMLGFTVITATLGVKQGSPTSCFLFTLFVDEFVRLVKSRCDVDGFLQWLHLLVLMDDTVLFATTRQGLVDKLNLLTEWCDRSGMVINQDKTEFMALNASSPLEKAPIVISPSSGEITVKHCDSYTYLGAIFTSDGKVGSTQKHHITSRTKAMNKLIIFLDRNASAPFVVKKKVLDACFNTSLLYGCEGWLGVKPSAEIQAFYMKAIKLLLGVRQSTHNDICLAESGYNSLEAVIRARQKVFFEKMMAERAGMTDDPLMFAIALTHESNKTMSKYLRELETAGDILAEDRQQRYQALTADTATRATTYCALNPDFQLHSVYDGQSRLDDDLRIEFTRLRLSSHRLRIETGRWSRTPREQRTCNCDTGALQTEKHVLVECPLATDIRTKYNNSDFDFDSFMSTGKSSDDLRMLREIMAVFE